MATGPLTPSISRREAQVPAAEVKVKDARKARENSSLLSELGPQHSKPTRSFMSTVAHGMARGSTRGPSNDIPLLKDEMV